MSETYYHTCEVCGANLDPGERCDCSIPLKETFAVSFDLNDTGKDISVATVFKLDPKTNKFEQQGILYGELADDLYSSLERSKSNVRALTSRDIIDAFWRD